MSSMCVPNTAEGAVGCARQSCRRGATLLEIAIVLVIVGVAITAMMEFMFSATRANSQLSQTALGLNYARAAQEWVASLSWSDLEDKLTGSTTATRSPDQEFGTGTTKLVDGKGNNLYADPAYQPQAGWSQAIWFTRVSSADLTSVLANQNDPTGVIKVVAQARFKGQPVCTLERFYAPPN